MPFIGIVGKESDCNFIKNEVIKNSCKNKFEFINITRQNIENLKNIRFETIVINDSNFYGESHYLKEIIKNAKYLLLNSDVIKPIDTSTNLITYGLNRNAIVTLSSIKNENIMICVQNEFKDIVGNNIEVQEINVEIKKNNLKKICNSLAVFAILVIYGENLKKI